MVSSATLDVLPVDADPFAVEFANTLYVQSGVDLDFLDDAWLASWFDRVDNGPVPEFIRSLRNATRDLLIDTAEGRRPSASVIARLNDAAARAPWRVTLEWPRDGSPVVSTTAQGSGADATIASIALECIEFIASPSMHLLRWCERPGCPMLFVKKHHKRRFCTDSCAHRARQSRYYGKHHAAGVL
ncbi:MAG: ABATE domain-containing protein [Pseudolysinimonas sp.]